MSVRALLPGVALAALAALVARPAPAAAQLTLADALGAADRGAYANRMAAGIAEAERARALGPLKGILPSARLEAGFVRTTDPIGAFGTTLRQRAVSPAAFDPARLNYPAPVGNYQTSVVGELPLFNGDAWAGRRAARSGADAVGAQAEWTRVDTRAEVVRAYYAAVLAAEKAATLQAAARAADAHVAQARAMVRQGMVTKADALLAGVRAGEVHAQLAEARGAAVNGLRQLATLLGRPDRALEALPTALPSSEAIRRIAAPDTALATNGARADVQAAEAGRDAARADVLRARAMLLPRVNAFGRYDWNAPSALLAGRKNWTVGVLASLPLFQGASELADVRGAAGRLDAARAGAEAAVARARLEDELTRTALLVALERLGIAEQGAAQGAEAQRLVEKRYAGGLAPVTELLDAQAAATGSALSLSAARYAVISAAAERRQALGADPGALAALDGAPAIATTALSAAPPASAPSPR